MAKLQDHLSESTIVFSEQVLTLRRIDKGAGVAHQIQLTFKLRDPNMTLVVTPSIPSVDPTLSKPQDRKESYSVMWIE